MLNQTAGVFDGVQTDRLAVRHYKLWHAAYLIWIECLHEWKTEIFFLFCTKIFFHFCWHDILYVNFWLSLPVEVRTLQSISHCTVVSAFSCLPCLFISVCI